MSDEIGFLKPADRGLFEMHQHQQCQRLKLQDLNSHLVCDICKGYLVEATTIVECLHSFCRSCLVRHIDRHAACPTCDAPLPKAKPFLHIRSDKTLQDIVYKLVPGLYHNEMRRRRDFYAKHPDEVWRTTHEERGTAMDRLVFSPQDQFSLSLEYFKPHSGDCRNDDWETGSTRSSTSSHESSSEGAIGRRYLQCPALFTVGLLKKFLRSKFELMPNHKVDVIHRKVCLPDDYTIMDVAYIYSWRQASPIRFFYRFYDDSRPAVVQPVQQQPTTVSKGKAGEMVSATKKRLSVDAAAKSDQETKTADAEKIKVEEKVAPPVAPKVAVVITQNENEHPVISIPSPPPSSESTPELDLLDIIDKNIKEETAALANNNNNEPSVVTERPKTPPKVEVPTLPKTPPPPLSVSITPTTTSPLTKSPISPVVTSPSKSKIRSPGSGSSILSIASELARKQQQQMEKEKSKSSSPVPAVVPTSKSAPAPPAPNPVVPSARLGSGKSSLEIKLVPSNAANKSNQPPKAELSKPQTSITLKSNVDKQPKVAAETVISKQSAIAKGGAPGIAPKSPQKRPHQPYKFHNYEHSLLKVAKEDPAKKAKIEEKPPAPLSPHKPSAKMYHSATISPFAPIHRPHTQPLSINPPSLKPQRPASLSSTSSPSPSPPSNESRHFPSPPQHSKKSPTLEPPLSPVNSLYNGLLAAAAVARHPNQAAAAALFMRQQLEYQRLYQQSAEWSFNPHFMHHSAAANTMKRLSEGYMRSLYPFGMGSVPTTSAPPAPYSSSISSSGHSK
ncbi:polycomb group protein Psc-like [Neocloeon triangulifer]|uniref:polycomb group protein Psc-like n=1 Tax=Neocloeon triangulifer TaxID=2078957 RepID=UPI00286F9138|nr:polycomb group protein Psc-like [Neocloeon triangulifer]